VDSARVSDDALLVKLRALASRDKAAELVVVADKATPHARITFLLEQAKKAGLMKIAFSVAP
jgi:biopolymer transport protein ExbD